MNAGEHKTAIDLATKFTGDPNKVMSTVAIAGSQQVMLKVRVVEVQRRVLKQLGVNTQAVFSVGKRHRQSCQHQSVPESPDQLRRR